MTVISGRKEKEEKGGMGDYHKNNLWNDSNIDNGKGHDNNDDDNNEDDEADGTRRTFKQIFTIISQTEDNRF